MRPVPKNTITKMAGGVAQVVRTSEVLNSNPSFAKISLN
jgi:hypothetical protein